MGAGEGETHVTSVSREKQHSLLRPCVARANRASPGRDPSAGLIAQIKSAGGSPWPAKLTVDAAGGRNDTQSPHLHLIDPRICIV